MASVPSYSTLCFGTAVAKRLSAKGTKIAAGRAPRPRGGGVAREATAAANVAAPETPTDPRPTTPARARARGRGGRSDDGAPPAASIAPPPPTTPPLLLEGDEMFVSRAGKSRTVHRLEATEDDRARRRRRDVLLEETYDVGRARKEIRLVGRPSLLNGDFEDGGNQLADVFSFDLQEIHCGVQNGSGTGSMSWDSSIAMGLYFAENPEKLRGDVLELGSGVGLGGILSNVAMNSAGGGAFAGDCQSLTLTDASDDVLAMLWLNTNSAAYGNNISVQKLDWFDFLGVNAGPANDAERYDTIIASDCAYLRSQIAPLSETVRKLLRRGRGRERHLHMFAPYNRGAVREAIEELRRGGGMHVQLEELEVSKRRIRQDGGGRGRASEGRCWDAGSGAARDRCASSKFLHITAWHRTRAEVAGDGRGAPGGMTDID